MLKKFSQKRLILLFVIALCLALVVTSVFSVTAVSAGQNEAKANDGSLLFEDNTEMSDNLAKAGNSNGSLDIKTDKPYDVVIVNDGVKQKVNVAQGTVADALNSAKVILGTKQAVSPAPNTPLEENMIIKISDGANVTITADGKTRATVAPLGNIAQAIKETGCSIGREDVCNYDFGDLITEGIDIKLQRVTYQEVTESEEIPFDTVTKIDSDLDEGETRVETDGENGLKEITKRVRYVDGKESDTQIVSENVTKEPVDKVVLEGQPETAQTAGFEGLSSSGGSTFVDENGNTVSFSRIITGSGTAYTAAPGACTATGVPAYQGGVAVNPNIIPYGTRLYIEASDGSYVYGYATAVDTGGALMSGSAIVDLFYPTYDQCVNFGRRNVNIYVLS